MSKASALLKNISVKTAERAKTERAIVDGSAVVRIPTFDRPTTLKATVRYFRIVDKRVKSMQTELEALKTCIRAEGQKALDVAFGNGQYYSAADCAGVKVTRANKFKAIDVDPNALRDAVGDAYGAMFQEEAQIAFGSAGELEQHLRACEEAGVPMIGKPSVLVTGRSGLLQRVCEMWDGLDEERRALLKACAQDQAPRVGGK